LGKDFERYLEEFKKTPLKSIRVNTLKISVEDLTKRLKARGWKIKQPFKEFPEMIIIESQLEPGELGRTLEHMLGYYYVQDISSMLPVLALEPEGEETILDLCASPGSKTTQIASHMANTGTIIANEISLGRIKILAANTERCGATNVIITKKDGFVLCKRLKEQGILFDKILLDAPCSGEGTMITKPKTIKMWNIRTVLTLSKVQKSLLTSAIQILKPGGTIVYSTCTHSPEENERVVDYILRSHPEIKIEKISLPIKSHQGLQNWRDESYFPELKYSCRIYPQDNGTEGFFIAKLRKEK
jgi:NOL1/NOP2/sun family putative RNA methylase